MLQPSTAPLVTALDVLGGTDPSVSVLFRGTGPYAAFDRPLPLVVESSVFWDFEGHFNQTQVRGPSRGNAEGGFADHKPDVHACMGLELLLLS